MKDSRKGESLWFIWEGEGFNHALGDDSTVFYTEDHIDVEIELVKRALASGIQRYGLVDSLSQGFRAIDTGVVTTGYCGYVDGDNELTICDEYGVTEYHDTVETATPTTFVEVYLF